MFSDFVEPTMEGGRSGSRGSKSSENGSRKKCAKGKFRPAGLTPMGRKKSCQTSVSKSCKKQVAAARRRQKEKNAEDFLDALEEQGLAVNEEGEVVQASESEAEEQGSPSAVQSPENVFGEAVQGGGRKRYRHRMRGGEIEGGEVEIEGGKRKLTAYNKFVRAFSMKHKGMSGKSLIRAAAKSWKKSPQRKRSHSKSR